MPDPLQASDPDIAGLIQAERKRQTSTLSLIASENYASAAVRNAMASELTNKYSEGYPGRRYYGGNEVVDRVEQLAIDRATALFGAPHANVQPHSGSSANLAAYLAVLKPGETALAMDMAAGGHLTHGARVSATGAFYHFVHYGVGTDGRIELDRVEQMARQHKPRAIVCGASAYPRTIDFAGFARVAAAAGAVLVADVAHLAGLIAARVHPTPVGHAPVITSSTHKTLRGPRGGFILCSTEWAGTIDKAVMPGLQGGPLEHVIAAKAVAFAEAARPEFTTYQTRVLENARALAAGLLSVGATLVTGGTDNHLVLLDLRPWGTTGKEAETLLEAAGVVANKNVIPGETRKPTDPSGLRLGTPALTTRGATAPECERLGLAVGSLLKERTDAAAANLKNLARELASAHPLPV
jgi:glycine hydroxymethyltransferase